MASSSGTATNFEDLFGRIVSFLTTNPALVAANQQWQVLRQHRDGIASITTNLTENTTAAGRRILHSFRWEPRSINSNDPASTTEGSTYCTNYVAGTSHVTMTLRAATEIKKVRLVSGASSNIPTDMLQNFRLQYSDNNSTWTTALTVASNPVYVLNDVKEFDVPGTTGSHLYWRILIDRKQSGTTTGSITWRGLHLLDASGSIANHFGNEVMFKAPGLSGTDNIYTGIRSEYDTVNGWYNLFLNGYSGYDPSVTSFFMQPGGLTPYGVAGRPILLVPMVPCWNAAMPYWFRATGRMFSFGMKVSTSFEGGYLGFLLPYASPAQFPYPLVVGGSLIPQNADRGAAWRYSYNDGRHSAFPIPAAENSSTPTGSDPASAGLYLRTTDNLWQPFGQRSGTTIYTMAQATSPPFARSGLRAGVWPTSVRQPGAGGQRRDYRDVLGGGYLLQPLILHQRLPTDAVWGELDGCYAISGFANASENTATFAGKNHIVFQNIARTEVHEYWAMVQD